MVLVSIEQIDLRKMLQSKLDEKQMKRFDQVSKIQVDLMRFWSVINIAVFLVIMFGPIVWGSLPSQRTSCSTGMKRLFPAPPGDVLPGISSKLGQSRFAKYHLDAGALLVAAGCKAAP